MSIETTAGSLAPKKKKYLPNKILRAIDSAAELKGLSTGVRATLQTICRYVSQHDPLGPVFTRREKIAARAGLSVRSVGRHLDTLTSLELLTIEDQRHGKRNGKFLVTHIFLTQKLAEIVGLIDAAIDTLTPSPAPAIPAQPSDKMSRGYINEVLSGPSSTKKQGRPQLSAPTIPADLQTLVEMGMMPETVCNLMRQARESGKRLSDIVAVVRDRISELGLKGGQIRNYLLKSIQGSTDFAQAARTMLDKARAVEQLKADKLIIDQFQAQYRGKVLTSADGRETLYVNADGTFGQHHYGTRVALMPLQNRLDVSQVLDKLSSGRLQLAQQAAAPAVPSTVGGQLSTEAGREVGRQQLAALLGVLKGGSKGEALPA